MDFLSYLEPPHREQSNNYSPDNPGRIYHPPAIYAVRPGFFRQPRRITK
jgi:hypothetical protein